MALILALAVMGAFLTSATLVPLGVGAMGVRYALAAVGGYLFFLSFVRLWIAYQTRSWSFGRREPGSRKALDPASTDLPDLSAPGGFGGGGGGGFSGGGGAFRRGRRGAAATNFDSR